MKENIIREQFTCLRDILVVVLPCITMSLSSISIRCCNSRCRLNSLASSAPPITLPSRSSLSITSCSFFCCKSNHYIIFVCMCLHNYIIVKLLEVILILKTQLWHTNIIKFNFRILQCIGTCMCVYTRIQYCY